MMEPPHKALKAALHDRIEAAAISPSIRCYRNVPEGTAFPYAAIGGPQGRPDPIAKDLSLWDIEQVIHFWSESTAETDVELLDNMAAALLVLTAKPLEITGWRILSQVISQMNEVGLDVNPFGVIGDHGVISIEFKMQASG